MKNQHDHILVYCPSEQLLEYLTLLEDTLHHFKQTRAVDDEVDTFQCIK